MFRFPKQAAAEPNKSSNAELLLNLSIFGFSRLSASDQREETEDICNKVVENVTVEQLSDESEEKFQLRKFAELFKKLPFPEQNLCLARVIKKLKHKRQFSELICGFRQLDAKRQRRMIRKITGHVSADENLQIPGETKEDFRLRRFTQLSRGYTNYVYTELDMRKRKGYNEVIQEIKDNGDRDGDGDDGSFDWQSRFAEFFLGFSIIWFKGQSAAGQKLLIQQLRDELGCEIYEDESDEDESDEDESDGDESDGDESDEDESDEDLRLRLFTELCEQVHVFNTQVRLLHSAEERLQDQRQWLPHGRLVQPQGSAGAAELFSRLSAFGFSLLSAAEQREKIEKLYNKVEGVVIGGLREEISDEEFRKQTFTVLFNKVSETTRIHLFKEVEEKFFRERKFCESILLFRQLGSNDQQYLLDKMVDMTPMKDAIVEKLIEESQEDFRLRRFMKLYKSQPYTRSFFQSEFEKLDRKGIQPTSADEEEIKEIKQARYAEFFFGFSIIWFKARCANDPRNPIQILLREAEVEVEIDHIIEKLSDETEEDFRLRRFTELFKKLQFSSQERIVRYIQKIIFHDLGYREHEQKISEKKPEKPKEPEAKPKPPEAIDGKPPYVHEFIKMKAIKVKGGGATTQGGQGTSPP